ncbi:hypothetical protein MNBD_ALPHA03-1286 [hydrothermal vent metagenome]|uniref:Uncharacterized protein n=1 Tax=hydrothermal vent metagenome TaxID=652676 RepID=A0A3B1ART5_9ZZZZ
MSRARPEPVVQIEKEPVVQIENKKVAQIFDDFPDLIRERLLFIRGLIFDEAEKIENIDAAALRHCISMALTYHDDRRPV